jgi:phosphoglycerol transferase MdoB-like AlkP superfamily enzyme
MLINFFQAGKFIYFPAIYLSVSFLFRIFLLIVSKKIGYDIFFVLFLGFLSDLPLALFIFLLSYFLYSFSLRFKSLKKTISNSLFFIFGFSLFFLFFTEYFFFEEFNSRFNSVSVDYLIYPTEVFVNIWQSYNVIAISSICAFLSLLSTYFFNKISNNIDPVRLKNKFIYILIFLVLLFIIPFNGFNFTSDRIKKEISKNGVLSFFYSAYSHNLDYDAFYLTLPESQAHKYSRLAIANSGEKFTENKMKPIERYVKKSGAEKKYNVMIFLMESFGSEFIGSLGSDKNITPNFDKLAREGVLFSNIYSIGNRTVRGLEGVLASFPPLPSESIVKMKFSNNIKTLPQILKEHGYENIFIYGGRGLFDNMKAFALRYGFDSFIEQKDFKNPVFTTIWGVCDEEIFDMSLEKAKESYNKGKPFFFLTLSVSNHKPYTYPPGRIPEDPQKKKRANAVKYTDWALGNFFDKAKKEPFYKNTIFVVIADHGARVYGSQEIPIKSYEIPLLIIAPGLKSSVNPTLGSSIDVPPTILDLLNLSYVSPFFGKSLFSGSKNRWVPLNHNRDIGYYDGKDMVVLGLNKTIFYYLEKGKSNIEKTDSVEPVKKDTAISIFQTAWEIYKNGL